VAVRVTPPAPAVIVAGVDVETALVVTVKAALVAPCATVTLAGTAAATALLASITANPPEGAAAVKTIVPCDAVPPATVAGFIEIAESAGGAAGFGCGVKLRTADHAPAVPAEFTPRTRHQCCCPASDVAVNCDAVGVCSTTRGAENVLESSTWIR
jgi:hypothetical protein